MTSLPSRWDDEAASPPPRPPKRSCSRGQCERMHAEADRPGTPTSDTIPTQPERVLERHSDEVEATPTRAAPGGPQDTGALVRFMYAGEAAASDDDATMLATVQLLNATTMTLSPSACRPIAAGEHQRCRTGVAAAPRHRDDDDVDNAGTSERGPSHSPDTPTDATDATDTTDASDTTDTTDASVHVSAAIRLDATSSATATGVAGAAEEDESDDEDEDGLFHETVLFTNHTLHSLGSTHRTPTATPAQPSPETAGSASPAPFQPRSLELTPVRRTGTTAAGGQTCLAADTPPTSPATTVATHAPVAAMSSPPTPQGHHRADPATASTSDFFFIDNRDGTAYLADASLQLDGSYALGHTVLLTRSAAATAERRVLEVGSPEVVVPPLAANARSSSLSTRHQHHHHHHHPVSRSAAHRQLRGTGAAGQRHAAAAAHGATSGSPAPQPIDAGRAEEDREEEEDGDVATPNIARVVVRRSAAPCRDSSDRTSSAWMLPSSFSDSFHFDQTLLVPLGASATMARSAVIAEMSMMSERSYRSCAPARCDAYASPPVVATPVLQSPSISSVTYEAAAATAAARRARGVARPSPSCSATPTAAGARPVSRASPAPATPVMAEQLAAQQARARRETRAARPDHDIIYLIPAGAATATMTPEDIINHGWMPVHVVDTLPQVRTATEGRGGNTSAGARPVRARSYIVGGGAESPLPKKPTTAASGPTARAGETVRSAEDACVREQSLSRLSQCADGDGDGGSDAASPPPFSPASTLSASTLECINRRLSYSMSRWASAHQRFGTAARPDIADAAASIALPPATPLSFVGDVHGMSPPQGRHHGDVPGASTSDRRCLEASSLCWGGEATFSGGRSTLLDRRHDGGRSPPPVPPNESETPEREQSPPRCDAVASPNTLAVADGRARESECADGAVATVDPSSLLTSMSYQRPSTAVTGVSESYANGGSLSIPLSSSASASLAVGAPRQGSRYAPHCPLPPPPPLPHAPLQLRGAHPHRISATVFSNGSGSLSISMQSVGERSRRVQAGAGAGAALPAYAAGGSSFRTTYCNHRLGATSLNPSSGGGTGGDSSNSNSASGAGLPLSRGVLGVSTTAAAAGGRGGLPYPSTAPRSGSQRSGLVRTHSTGSMQTGKAGGGAAMVLSVSGSAVAPRDALRPHHHFNAGPHQQQQQQRQRQNLRRTATAVRGAAGPSPAGHRRRVVPDTSVFLPWSPITITPESSVNFGAAAADGPARRSSTVFAFVPMTLVPFTSSAETSTTTTATTTTTTREAVSASDVAAPMPSDSAHDADGATVTLAAPRPPLSTMAAAMLRAAATNRQPPAVSLAAPTPSSGGSGSGGVGGVGGVGGGGAAVRDSLLFSFLQHAASQTPVSVEDSVSEDGVFTASSSAAAAAAEASNRKSMALSRVSWGLTPHDGAGDFNSIVAAAMEATVNQFQASLCAASTAAEQEPQPAVPATSATSAHQAGVGGAVKENRPGQPWSTARGAGQRKSESPGATRPLGLREAAATNVVARLSSKARSPSQASTANGSAVV
ncbi:hypothetical protein NESM_000431400 [Novymonas esmeraldas]|uniref:Uncharacterized protein n=1 Tax=Novymonas esmeraldas TaxID=1808958 RepID=A0AAW0ELU9_9TRYP